MEKRVPMKGFGRCLPVRSHRRGAGPASVVIAALLAGGCSGQPNSRPAATGAAASSPVASAPASGAGSAPAGAGEGPMTAEELLWLDGISTLHKKIDEVLTAAPAEMSPENMRPLAERLRGCTRDLARLAAPTSRLQPVYELAKQGCAKYDDAAKCFDTAASIGIPVAGSANDRKLTESIKCGFAKPGDGSHLLAIAETKGTEIKETVR